MLVENVNYKRIAIVGCGGIGSKCAELLTRCGLLKLKLIDFDFVERSNLNRQFYFEDQINKQKVDMLEMNLKRINKDVDIIKNDIKITEDNIDNILNDCDIIVEAFDGIDAKKMLFEAFAESDKIIVAASGVAGDSTHSISTKKMGNAYIVGDFESDVKDNKLYSHKIQAITAVMAEIVATFA